MLAGLFQSRHVTTTPRLSKRLDAGHPQIAPGGYAASVTRGDGVGFRLPLVIVALVLLVVIVLAVRGCGEAERVAQLGAVQPSSGGAPELAAHEMELVSDAPRATVANSKLVATPSEVVESPVDTGPSHGELTGRLGTPASMLAPPARPSSADGAIRFSGVVRESNGAPLVDVVVAAQLHHEAPPIGEDLAQPTTSTRTDERGGFALELDAPGIWTVGVDPAACEGELALGPPSRRMQTLGPGTGTDVVLHATRIPSESELGRWLRARVETPDGAPVAGAYVHARRADRSGIRRAATAPSTERSSSARSTQPSGCCRRCRG